MENLNTQDFWDNAFKQEYDKMITGKDLKNLAYYRFNGARYQVIAREIPHDASILDIGCGLGHFVRFLKAYHPLSTPTGVDFSAFAIQEARMFDPMSRYEVANCYDLSIFPDESFDTVHSAELLEHLEFPEKFLKEACRVGKKRGTLIITTPVQRGEGGVQSEEHLKEYTTKEFIELMSRFILVKDIIRIDISQIIIGKILW